MDEMFEDLIKCQAVDAFRKSLKEVDPFDDPETFNAVITANLQEMLPGCQVTVLDKPACIDNGECYFPDGVDRCVFCNKAWFE